MYKVVLLKRLLRALEKTKTLTPPHTLDKRRAKA